MFRFITVGLAGLLLAGCVADEPWGLPQVALSQSPDNPSIASRNAAYRSVIGGYTPRTPSEPRSFRDTGVEISPVGVDSTSSPERESAPAGGSSMPSMPGMDAMSGGTMQ
tara:strand:+ start:952 stop:1281 length:330 start_codon:yes stop_codon:yes gene_type:complete